MIFGENTSCISLNTISSDDDSTVSDDGKNYGKNINK